MNNWYKAFFQHLIMPINLYINLFNNQNITGSNFSKHISLANWYNYALSSVHSINSVRKTLFYLSLSLSFRLVFQKLLLPQPWALSALCINNRYFHCCPQLSGALVFYIFEVKSSVAAANSKIYNFSQQKYFKILYTQLSLDLFE